MLLPRFNDMDEWQEWHATCNANLHLIPSYLSVLVAFVNQIVDWKMFTNDMQVHHGGAGTTATGLRAGVNAFCR